MLKFYDTAVTFSEFPDEIAICANITNCPCNCDNCSEPWLKDDIGEVLDEEAIQKLLNEHKDCSVFGIMGGDSDQGDIIRIADYIHSHSNLKVGFYSGRDYINIQLVPHLDYYKIGRWITPVGEVDKWPLTTCGPLQFPFTNQIYFQCIGDKLINCSHLFRKNPIHDLQRYVIAQ
ncbi:MAG: hypothetical protein J6S67_07635 [Methanobrevibacter sp.]|nr:hypothetical protein [Methanobrevibacter sp.]